MAPCIMYHQKNTQVVSEPGPNSDLEAVAACLAPRALRVQLHGLNGLLANGLLGGAAQEVRGDISW